MKFKGYPLEHLPARAVLSAQARLTRLKMEAQRRFPQWLGLPALGPYVQFYREDALFRTQFSIFNYYSTFYPEHEVRLDYRISAFDRSGKHLGSGDVILAAGESMQRDLSEVIPAKLDEFGLFSVMAKPVTQHVEQVKNLGTTTCQFMTLYFPADSRAQAPQIIHSHKLLQQHWMPKSRIVRESHISEDLSTRTLTEFYFLNSCPATTTAVLHVLDGMTGKELTQKAVAIPGHGVSQITLVSSEMPGSNGLLAFEYEFDRRISHQKPIVFRHQQHGIINCNHS
jgi:hypothetical protein